MNSDKYAMLGLVIGCIVFGLGSLIVAYVSLGAYALTVWRLAVASLIFFIIYWVATRVFKKALPYSRDKKAWVFMALAGIFLGFDLALWHESIHAVGPGISTLLNSLQIFFLSAIGYVFFKETLSRWQIASLLIAIVGVAFIASPEFSHNLNAGWGFVTGIVSGSMLAASMASIRKVHDYGETHIIPLMLVLGLSGMVAILPIALLTGENFIPKNITEWSLVIIYGSVMQCLAWGLIAQSIPKLSLAVTGLLLLTEPVAAIFIDYFYLHKPIALLQWIGVLLTLLAIYLGSVSVKKKG